MSSEASIRFIVTAALTSVLACSAQLSLTPEEEVRPGDALGFDYIVYVTNREQGNTQTQKILEVEADGRTSFDLFVRGDGTDITEAAPFRFLSDARLQSLRTAFADSDFFTWSDSVYGDPDANERTRKTIAFQKDGRNDQLQRIEDADVPPSIRPLFDALDILISESQQFEVGTPVDVTAFASGTGTAIDRREFAVIKTTDDLVDLVRRMGSDEISVLSRVDFAREMIVAVFLGDVDAGVVGVSFLESAYEDDDVVKVQFTPHESADPCPGGRHPYALARIPRTSSRVEFYEAAEPLEVACRREADS